MIPKGVEAEAGRPHRNVIDRRCADLSECSARRRHRRLIRQRDGVEALAHVDGGQTRAEHFVHQLDRGHLFFQIGLIENEVRQIRTTIGKCVGAVFGTQNADLLI